MIDRVLGSDNELRGKGKRRGGELVRIDSTDDPSKGDTGKTAAASNVPAIGQSAETDGNDGDSDYENEKFEEEYTQMMYEQDML